MTDTGIATDQVLGELQDSIEGQYGPQPAPAPEREQAMRDYRHTVIKLYGPTIAAVGLWQVTYPDGHSTIACVTPGGRSSVRPRSGSTRRRECATATAIYSDTRAA